MRTGQAVREEMGKERESPPKTEAVEFLIAIANVLVVVMELLVAGTGISPDLVGE